MLFLRSMCGLLTLQVGVVTWATIFTTFATCVFLANVLDFSPENKVAWIILIIFLALLVIIWIIAFCGAFYESSIIILTVTILWTIHVIFWLTIDLWTLLGEEKIFCIESRCPNVLWLINKQSDVLRKCKSDNTTNSEHNTLTRYENDYMRQNNWEQLIKDNATDDEIVDKSSVKPPTFKDNSSTQITPITVSIIFTLLLLYAWTILLSYLLEMQCKKQNCPELINM